MIEIHPVPALGEVRSGDDLAGLLAGALKAAALTPRQSDILIVTQKIVSKAEGRFVDLARVSPGAEARRLAEITRKDARFVEVVLSEAVAVLRAAPHVLITRHRCGYVMANSGIDRSNIGPGADDCVLLLPEDADRSAARLREGLGRHFDHGPAIVISDSFGRPWRMGVVNVAIGAGGLPSLIDRRGARDRDGRLLEVTQVALADMAASAAGLVMGEAGEGVPAALLRGLSWETADLAASALIRPLNEDLFR